MLNYEHAKAFNMAGYLFTFFVQGDMSAVVV